MKLFKELFQYRELLKSSAKKEIRGKYKGAWLGIIWSFLNPLLMLCVYSVVFSQIMRVNIDNYTMFLFTGLLPWTYFTITMTTGANSIVAMGGIIKKIYFPREIIPISVVISNTITFLISCIIMLVFLFITGIGLSVFVLYFPLILLTQFLLLIGLSFIISSITVYARDIEHLISVFLMALFYGTPIIYTLDMVPESMKFLINLNPMTPIISSYRDILFFQKNPNIGELFLIMMISIVICIIGYTIFNKLQRNFAEEL